MAFVLGWRETYVSRQQAIRQYAAAAAAVALFAAADANVELQVPDIEVS